jgi:hypothetical protein
MGSKIAESDMKDKLLYHEKLTSNRTTALFLGLTFLFLLLFIWRVNATGLNGLAVAFLIFSLIFLFYTVNFRSLILQITSTSLVLRFGVFTWRVLLNNIASCLIDDIPAFLRYGGAGIHFMTVHERYRVNINFLEYPRLVVALKQKAGPVKDVSFSTRKPDDILEIIDHAIRADQATPNRHSVSIN